MGSLWDEELWGHQDSGRPPGTRGRWRGRKGTGEKGKVWAMTRPEWRSVQRAG